MTTASGERLRATVVAACHVLTTLDLAADGLPSGSPTGRGGPSRSATGSAWRCGWHPSLPAYPDAPADVHSGLGLLAPDRQMLAAAYGDHLAGRPPAEPPAVVMGFSGIDPTLAPPERHLVTVWGQWYPYEPGGRPASWEGLPEQPTVRLLATVDAAAPGFSGSVQAASCRLPRTWRRARPSTGQRHARRHEPAVMFAWRPLPELSGYRTPVAGLYLAGASTHPGGGVCGASGRSAARVVLADRARAAPPARGTCPHGDAAGW